MARATTRVRGRGKNTGEIYDGIGILKSANNSRRLPRVTAEDLAQSNTKRLAKAKSERDAAKAEFNMAVKNYADFPTTFSKKDLQTAATKYGEAEYLVKVMNQRVRELGSKDWLALKDTNKALYRYARDYRRTH